MNTGFIESGYSEYDYNFDELFGSSYNDKKSDFPMAYNCMDYCDLKVEDQGSKPQCVAYALAKVLEYNHEILNNTSEHFNVDKQEIYDSRSNKDEDNGMMIREALHFVRHNKYYIKSYGRLSSRSSIMTSLFVNGPCIFALPVYDSTRSDFWNGNNLEGGHAVCCVGYNEDGFIILNSWGEAYGDYGMGTAILPYSKLGKIIECWAVIA